MLMRKTFLCILGAALLFPVSVSANTDSKLTRYLFLGSTGPQVALVQQILNKELSTRVAESGPGSPGNETEYFGTLTQAAVIRFQEKYANDILVPAGLTQGNGQVGVYTRAKLTAIAFGLMTATAPKTAPGAASTEAVESSPQAFLVKDDEKIDIYAGDKKLSDVQQKFLSAINAAIAAGSAPSMPTVAVTDVPDVVIETVSSHSGLPGSRISIATKGISEEGSVYFGNEYIVRAVKRDSTGNLSFTVPPIPPGLYDLAIKSAGTISNTALFVVVDPRNPPVIVQSVSPSVINFNDTITIHGSGFTQKNNVVITNYQRFASVASSDGKTLTVVLTPENLREAAKIGQGTRNVQLFVYIANENGISAKKYFTMTI